MRQPHPELNFRMGKGRFRPTLADVLMTAAKVGGDDALLVKIAEEVGGRPLTEDERTRLIAAVRESVRQ